MTAELTLHPLLVLLILLLAVGAGLWVGTYLGKSSREAKLEASRRRREPSFGEALGDSAKGLISGSATRLWRWRRERNKRERERERERERARR